jgi:hypothetical protein
MINLDIHQVESIAVVSRVFNTFRVYEFTFIDTDGRRVTVKAFTHRPQQVEIERMPDEDCSK